jgi:hypothetical protein
MKKSLVVNTLFLTLVCPIAFAGKPPIPGKTHNRTPQGVPHQASPAATQDNKKISTDASSVIISSETLEPANQPKDTPSALIAPITSSTTQPTSDNADKQASATMGTPVIQNESAETSSEPIKVTTDVRYDITRAHYTPRDPFVPEQGYFSIGYEKVTSQIQKIPLDTSLSPEEIENNRTKVSKALRDIYFYLDKAIIGQQFLNAKKYITDLKILAMEAEARKLLPEDKKDNICAWVNKYMTAIDAHEKAEVDNINKWRSTEITDKDGKVESDYFDTDQLAVALGLKDDFAKAIDDLEHLDPKAVEAKRPYFSSTIASLLADLSDRANIAESLDQQAEFINYFKQALTAARSKEIALDPTQMITTNKVINTIQEKNTKATLAALKHGIQLELALKRAHAKIHKTSEELFGNKITNQLENSDTNSLVKFYPVLDDQEAQESKQ